MQATRTSFAFPKRFACKRLQTNTAYVILHCIFFSDDFCFIVSRIKKCGKLGNIQIFRIFLITLKKMLAGFYYDPWHGGCLRRILRVNQDTYKILGVYGNDDSTRVSKRVEYDLEPALMTNKFWHAKLIVVKREEDSYLLSVDFSEKRGKKRFHYKATYVVKERVIKWDDTNIWKQMYYHPKQLR